MSCVVCLDVTDQITTCHFLGWMCELRQN